MSNYEKLPSLDASTASTPSVSKSEQSTNSYCSSTEEDIRLCTIHRVDANDIYGFELNYHRREQFHSLGITTGRNNGPSNAERAGIKDDDRLIEINGHNIENLDHDQLTQHIRSVKYPEPLEMLVTDAATYKDYKQQGKLIHHGLSNVKIIPANIPDCSVSLALSSNK